MNLSSALSTCDLSWMSNSPLFKILQTNTCECERQIHLLTMCDNCIGHDLQI